VKSTKSVKFSYTQTPQTRRLLEVFRDMVNEAICICLRENIVGRYKLRNRIYKVFQEKYVVGSRYPYSVSEVAWSIVKKHRHWGRRPFAKRLMMKMEAQSYSIHGSILSLSYTKRERILVPIRCGPYQETFLDNNGLKRGSLTMTESAVMVTFSKETTPYAPVSKLGVDLNERSVVCSNGSAYDLRSVSRMHTEYGIRRAEFSSSHPRDLRLLRKYAAFSREHARIRQTLHRTAKDLVESAKSKRQVIILEALKGIRRTHTRKSRESRGRRRRISHWPFRVFQDFVVYKANWEGVPVEFVSAAWTSRTCSRCRNVNRNLKVTEREWLCPNCGAILDRDLNAAVNIERRGKTPCLGEVRPGAQGTDEAVNRGRADDGSSPLSRSPEVEGLGNL
jgi:putative transposase